MYHLIPFNLIDEEARSIAVSWVENYDQCAGSEIAQKHKLASDIMNYAELKTNELRKEIERLKKENNTLGILWAQTTGKKYV